MTIKELIEELKNFPEDFIVKMEGYDTFEEAGKVELLDLEPHNSILIRNTDSLEKEQKLK
uniref:Uncharacterized protein n=1 Tax=viral metagenome TaxID=1070528 RepID=A0A6M3IVF8_9ZZZZ